MPPSTTSSAPALFLQKTGKTPLAYLTEVRLAHARELLMTTHLSIAEIAAQCGFCNASYMIKTFKSYYGVTPGLFRHENIPAPDGFI